MTQYMHPSALEFLNIARGDDEERPSLQKIAVHNSFLVSADGFRLHAIRFPAETDASKRDKTDIEPGTLCDIYLVPERHPSPGQTLEIVATNKETSSSTLLDSDKLKSIIPPENPAGYYAVSREHLIDALNSMPGDIEAVVLEMPKDNKLPMCIYGGGGCFALIMPRLLESITDEIWRPL